MGDVFERERWWIGEKILIVVMKWGQRYDEVERVWSNDEMEKLRNDQGIWKSVMDVGMVREERQDGEVGVAVWRAELEKGWVRWIVEL